MPTNQNEYNTYANNTNSCTVKVRRKIMMNNTFEIVFLNKSEENERVVFNTWSTKYIY